VDAILMDTGREVETICLRKYIALDKHRMDKTALTENAVKQRSHLWIDAQPMQRLVRPQAAKHGHITWLWVLAGSGRIGGGVCNAGVRGKPSALLGPLKKPIAHRKDRLSR
jgi:hypothetical protein